MFARAVADPQSVLAEWRRHTPVHAFSAGDEPEGLAGVCREISASDADVAVVRPALFGPAGDKSGQEGIAMPEDTDHAELLRRIRKSTGFRGELQVILSAVILGLLVFCFRSQVRFDAVGHARSVVQSHSETQTR